MPADRAEKGHRCRPERFRPRLSLQGATLRVAKLTSWHAPKTSASLSDGVPPYEVPANEGPGTLSDAAFLRIQALPTLKQAPATALFSRPTPRRARRIRLLNTLERVTSR